MRFKTAGVVSPTFQRQDRVARADSGGNVVPFAATIKQASSFLQLDAKTIRAMWKAGEIVGNRRGHAIRINGASLIAWLDGARSMSSEGK